MQREYIQPLVLLLLAFSSFKVGAIFSTSSCVIKRVGSGAQFGVHFQPVCFQEAHAEFPYHHVHEVNRITVIPDETNYRKQRRTQIFP